MILEQAINDEYTHILNVKVSKTKALLLINEQLQIPIKMTTMVANAKRVSELVKNHQVEKPFWLIELPKNSHSYSLKFLVLLLAYLKKVDQRKNDGASPKQYGSNFISEEMILKVDMKKLIDSIRNRMSVKGKNLATFFTLEEINISKSSLYNYYNFYKEDKELQKECPNLPPLQYGRVYTPEEVDQWRNFIKIMKERPHSRRKSKQVDFVI